MLRYSVVLLSTILAISSCQARPQSEVINDVDGPEITTVIIPESTTEKPEVSWEKDDKEDQSSDDEDDVEDLKIDPFDIEDLDAKVDKYGSIIQSYMTDEKMINYARRFALMSLTSKANSAAYVKAQMDATFGGKWQVVMGSNYVFKVDIFDNDYIFMWVKPNLAALVFRVPEN